MGYLMNIINDARGVALTPAATLTTAPATPHTEGLTSADDGAAAEHPMSSADSTQSEERVPMDEPKPLPVRPDERWHEDSIGQSTTGVSLHRDAAQKPDPENPLLTTLPNSPLQAAHHDSLETGGLGGASRDEQQPASVNDDFQQEVAVGWGLAETPVSRLTMNENLSYPERPLPPKTDQSRSQKAPAGDEHTAAQPLFAKNLGPATNPEKDIVHTAAQAAGQDETTPPFEVLAQGGPEDAPESLESAQPIAAERRDATPPTVTAPRSEPRVHIGRVDIVVMAPEPPATSRADAWIDNSDFASRHYLRGL